MLGEVPLARVIARARGVRRARAARAVGAVAVVEVARAVEAVRKGASIIRNRKTGTEGPGGTLEGVLAHTVARAMMDAAAEMGTAVRTGNTVQVAMAGETGGLGA
jgi:hypothetical protein